MWFVRYGMSCRNVIEYVDSISVVYAVNICGKIVVDKMSHRDYIKKIFWERKQDYVFIRSRKFIRNYSDNAD